MFPSFFKILLSELGPAVSPLSKKKKKKKWDETGVKQDETMTREKNQYRRFTFSTRVDELSRRARSKEKYKRTIEAQLPRSAPSGLKERRAFRASE